MGVCAAGWRWRVEDLSGLPEVPELPKFGGAYRSAHLTAELPCNVDHGIIGLMDPAHGPFVHRAWWWRSAASIHEKTKKFEPLDDSEHGGRNAGFRMSAHAPSSNSAPYKLLGKPVTTIDFVLPNRRIETIRAVNAKGRERWFASLTTVTPVTATSCRIDVIAAWDIAYHLPLVLPIARYFGAKFVAQDQQTMVEQARGLRSNPGLMLIGRCGHAGEVVLRVEATAADRGGRASAAGAGGAALEKLRSAVGRG